MSEEGSAFTNSTGIDLSLFDKSIEKSLERSKEVHTTSIVSNKSGDTSW